MTTTYEVTAEATTVPPTGGSVRFTARNTGDQPQRVVAAVEVLDGAATQAWFTVEQPLRTLDGHGKEDYVVTVAVPADAAPGTSHFGLKVYSEDLAPEETAVTSAPVAVTIPAPVVPERRPKWWLVALIAAAVLILVIGTVLVLRRGGAGAPAGAPTVTSPVADSTTVCGAERCTVSVAWQPVDGADRYRVRVADQTAPALALFDTEVIASPVEVPVAASGTLVASVTPVKGTKPGPPANRSFTVVVLPPPTITAPAQAAEQWCGVGDCTTPVTWDAVPDATGYQVTIGVPGNEGAPIAVTGTSATLPVTRDTTNVVSVTATAGTATGPTARRPFTVRSLAPPANARLEARQCFPFFPCQAILSWDPVPGADSYAVEVEDGSSFITTATSVQVQGRPQFVAVVTTRRGDIVGPSTALRLP